MAFKLRMVPWSHVQSLIRPQTRPGYEENVVKRDILQGRGSLLLHVPMVSGINTVTTDVERRMRAWEFLVEVNIRNPVVTLKSLNAAKQDRKYRERCAQDRLPVVSVMYRNLDRDKEWLEVEQMRLELEQKRLEVEQQKAEFAATNALSDAASQERVLELAKAALENRKKGKQKVSQLARSARA